MYLTCPSVQSVRWATWADPTYTSPLHDDFYTSPLMRGWYKSWASTLISRVNTITGVSYRNEPAIFAWELANEPRCQGMGYASSNNCSLGFGATGVTPTVGVPPICVMRACWCSCLIRPRSSRVSTQAWKITSWAAEMSSYIKSQDPNHLISVGDEGYMCQSSLVSLQPYFAASLA